MAATVSSSGWCGVVLAGGRSSRMGRDKALIERDGRTMLEHAIDRLRLHVEALLIIGDPVRHALPGVPVIADDVPGQGPLGGIVTALSHTAQEKLFVLACDMPHITDRFIERLMAVQREEYDAVVAQCDGDLEPLAAVYNRRCVPVFSAQIAHGRRKMSEAIALVHARYVQICPGEEGWPHDLFHNINAPGDL